MKEVKKMIKMSRVTGNLSSGFPTRYDTNRNVQPQKIARGLKIRIEVVEGLYYLCSENKGADQLICGLVFEYGKAGFLATLFISNTHSSLGKIKLARHYKFSQL